MNEEYTYNIGKYTIGVDTNGEDGIGLTVAIINDDGGIHLLGNCYGDNARCIDLLIKENQQLKEQLEQKENEIKELCKKLKVNEKSRRKMQKSLMDKVQKSEKARKEAIKYVKKTSGYDNPYNDTFLNTYAVDNLLEILDKGE